ncbi:unnamed protein product [Medioppia subpectinata]|uniref:Uncharacterized protein n=1 Tax=Medioppia subpectinata TaxID=1979941 RepID=A0A7R9KPP8_9ACAR|nr:unnamed protein product [Medioppia subpectinata]CAG2107530.1 unnamed protein product [Medioppia subpectinata]
MTIDTNLIMKLVVDVMGDRQIQVTVTQSLKGALLVGTCSFVGALLAGPVGLAIGGASGGVAAAFATNGTFRSITQTLNDLPFEKKRQIAEEIQSIIDKLEVNDLTELTKIAMICASLSRSDPNVILIKRFVEQTVPVIQRHILLQPNVNQN